MSNGVLFLPEGVAPLVDDPAMSRLDRIPVVNAPAPPEDYYEEVDRNRQQPYPQRAPVLQPLPRPALDTKVSLRKENILP